MIKRKKKIFIIQILFLITGLIVLIYTYKIKDSPNTDRVSSLTNQDNNNIQNNQNNVDGGDIFYNIKYSGLDLAGNRYILRAKTAITDKINEELINMDFVDAVFYFKDGTKLNVLSEKGIYNNKTLDITFTKNVEAEYKKDKLYSQKAEYSNFKNYIIISDNVSIVSEKGNLFADTLLFDVEKKTLNISSLNDSKVNAYIDVK
ncbi:LPS export ABC transporter periplasmic protein LptC [Pelagibacteraceae bacterium]|nr:LPS export ABC transporter periplasmic protein LptC [Pelagibacteraceae bacterium]